MISKRVDVERVEKEVPRDLEEIAAKLLQAARKHVAACQAIDDQKGKPATRTKKPASKRSI
jgi:hypothetical protein